MATKPYLAKTPIEYNGKPFAEGETLELDDKTEAPQLIAVGAVEPVEAAKGKKQPAAA